MAGNAETLVLRLVDQVTPTATAVNGALAQLQARSDALRARLAQPMKSSAYRQLQDDIVAAGGAADTTASSATNLASAEDGAADAASNAADSQSSAAAAADELATAEDSAADAASNAASSQSDAAASASELAGANAEAGDSADGGSINVMALAKASKMMGGEAGAAASKVLRLAKTLSKLPPEVALVVVGLALLAGAIAATIAIFSKGISAADDLRNEFLKLQGAAKGNAQAAKEAEAAINAVAPASSVARDKLADMAAQLEAAGLKGAELQRALEAMAIGASAGGDTVANAFLASAKAAKAAGGSVDELSAKMKTQLGGVASAQAIGLSAQAEKLHESIAAIFSGANIEPFLKGLHAILSLFDQNHAAGKALKAAVTDFVEYGIGAVLKFATAVVKLYIVVRQNTVAWTLLKVMLYSVAAVFAILGLIAIVALVAIALAVGLITLPIFLVIALVVGLYMVFRAVWTRIKSITWADIGRLIVYALLLPFAPLIALYLAAKAAYTKIKGISWADVGNGIKGAFNSAMAWLQAIPGRFVALGAAIINGLVSGLKAAGGAVLAALTGIVGGAVAGVKSLLGIASPSKVFHAMGGHMAAGMSQGVDSGSGDVASSAKSMAGGAVRAASGAKGKGGGGPSFSFNNCTFGGDLTKEKLESWLLGIMERGGLDQGATA